MPFDAWSTLQKILVVGLDTPAALRPALVTLQWALPQAEVAVLGCTAAWEGVSSPLASYPLYVWPDLEAQETAQQGVVEWMRNCAFEAAILFTAPGQSPYALAYLCYLGGIPVRIGQSREFGGGVLSHCLEPEPDAEDRQIQFLRAAGLPLAHPLTAEPLGR